MSVALVIVNYNTREDLRKCLESVHKELAGINVVVVDNGSTDGSRKMVKEEFSRVRLVENPGNPGYASACNRGIRETVETYIFILNSDVEFPPQDLVYREEDGGKLQGGLEDVLGYMDRNPDVGALGPLVLNSDGSTQMSCRRFPSMLENVMHGFLGDIWPGNPFTRSYQMKDACRDEPREVDWVSGAAMLLRREAAERVGGFDETYFMYVEDVDLCWRLREAGYRVVYNPAFRLIHHIGRTSSQQSVRMLYHHHRSMFFFFRRRYRGWRGMLLLPVVLTGLAIRFALSLLIKGIRAFREGGSGA